ncbi:E3 SUMO-protein ligase RanBP2-like isoform X21 [Cygnus olor]|uniref:E3 SUMO-protein ligase RanBP2-like isoform X21 n=1 Tax=Cygnus olor TaxID=8869 RepID=UPI001ADE83FA|nr:E3 SUMO-protein ligase RanBP2-like isoform X21 [Cygnus olor]
MLRRSKAEVERYVAAVQAAAPSLREKSLKGFLFAKLYFEVKEYELAKRYICTYLSVQERDPKAHRFLGQIYEAEDNTEKAFGCYKRSVELNPAQKDLILKIAELLCNNDVTDERAKYWVEKSAKLFPGSPAVYKLKEQLLDCKGEDGWNQLFDLIQAELYARPDDIYINIRLVALYRSNNRLRDAVLHCQEAKKKIPLQSSLEWCSCVIETFEEYLESVQDLESDKSNWRTIKKDQLLAYCSFLKVTLSSRDAQECRGALKNLDRVLHSVKTYVSGTDELSRTFIEMKGQLYMHAGTLLLKLAQQNEAQWKEACELAALCYLISFQVPKPKSKLIKGEHTGQDTLEMLACDRKSQSGHMLLKLSHGKEDFLKEVVESLANKSGSSTLFGSLFENGASRERSFLGTDDIGNVSMQAPVQAELHKYDLGAVRMHNGSLQHLVWLCLQWFLMSVLPPVHRWLKQLFHLPQETSRLETDAPESICLLDLEVFLLGVVFTSNLQLQEKFNAHYSAHQPQFLPLLVCKQLYTEKQRAWWDAVRTLMQRKTIPETALKLRLVVQHGISTLRALEKHGLQPALIIHWAKTLQKTGISLNSFYDQKEYVGRSVYYWKRVLIMLEIVKKKRSIPEPTDPLFKHFRSVDIQVSQVTVYEEEARIAFATLDAVDGRTDDALLAFEAIKNVVSYWNLAIIFQRKAEEIENDAMLPEEQEEHKAYLFKSKHYLMKILDESSSDVSVTEKLPVSVETVREMLDTVIQELGENDEEGSLAFGNDLSPAVDSEVKHSTPLSNNFSVSPSKSYKFSPKNPPQWAEDHRSILQMICQQVEALKNEMQKMKHNNSNSNVSSHRWPGESYGTDTMSDTYQRAQNLHEAPLTVATTGPSVYYSQSPAYNSQYLLRTAATNVTPTKAPVYGMNRLAPQQHIYAYQQTIHTPPLQNTSACVFPQDLYGTSLRFDAPGIISPRGTGDYYNYSVPQASTNPQLPGPGYFTKPSVTPTTLKPAESKMIEFPKSKFGQPGTVEGSKTRLPIPAQSSQPTTFKFNTNFKSNDGDFTFSSPQATTQPANAVFNSSESLLGLLTSDKPLQDDRYAEQKAVNNHTTGQRNVFSFGNKHISGIPFTEGMAQNAHKNLAFERSDMFSFQEPSKSLFMTSTSDLANRSHETEGGSTLGDENDDGPHFDPVVPLPDKIEVKTGEEDEEEFFCNRAKLFRFDAESKEWKERGIGNVKILKHKVSGKFRLLMRRDQVLKICANHYINTDMKLTPNAGSDRSFVWHALDYADELPKPEQLAIRFKTPEEAMLFKSKFEESQNILKTLGSNVDTSVTQSSGTAREMTSQDIKKSNGSTSGTLNSVFQFPKDGVTSESGNKVSLKSVPSASALPTFSFRKEAQETLSSGGFGQSLLKKDQWECKVCSVPNEATAKNCVSCQSPNADTWQTYGTPSTESTPSFKATGNTVQDKFGSAFAKKEGQLDGSIRSVRNEPVASQNPSKMNTEISPQVSFKFVLDAPKTIQNDLGTPFSKKAGQWDCSVGLAQNEANDENCHSCQNPKSQSQPNVPVSTAQALPAPSFSSVADATATKPQENTFAELFAKKEGQWDCNTCLVRNEGSSPACVACQTPNPSGNSVNDASSTSTSDLKSKLSEPAKGQLGTGFKCDFLGKGFKLGHAEQGKTPAFTFQIPADSEVKSAKEGFNFSMSVPPGGFKFSIQEPSKNATKKDDPSKECTAGSLKNVDENFADGERKVELLAVRFKQQDVADSFKQIFDEAKNAQEKGTLITPLYSRANTPKESPCGKNAVAVLEETTRERTDLSQGDDTSEVTVEASEVSSTSETPTKTVVSPPKFVFGSESVKSIFSNEKSKTFTFGNTSATGSLFGFSFNSPRKGEGSIPASEKEVAGPRSSSALQKPQDSKACNLATSTHDGPANFSFRIVEKAEEKTVPEDDLPTDEVIIVYELTPTPEQRALAGFLKLPSTFFCYKNKPGYVSEEDDDEDYETAVKNLNGRLYQEKKRKLQGSAKDMPENTTGDITGKTDLKTEGECVTAENTEENDVTSSTDLVSTTKEEPTESADEAIAHVQSAEEPDSSTGNTSDISLAYQASKNSGYLAFNSVDNTLPSCLAESAQENGEQNITGGLVGKTESGTEAQEFNRQGLILPHISQIYNELHVTYQELQRERSAREQYALELQRLECFLVQRETLLYRREAALAEMKRAEEEVQARFGIIKKQHETEVNRMRETLRRVTEENSKLKSSFNSVMEEDDSLRKQLSDANEQNKMLEDRARSMQAQLDNLQQHEAEMNQMRETLRQVTEENSKLKLSFNSVMEEDDSLRKQLSDANEQNKMLEDQARSMQAQLDNLQQKNASLMAQKSKDSGEVVRPCQPVKEGKETGASKSVKQHEAEMNQMRETLRQVTEENSKLKLSFNSVMGENDSLRKQLSDANEQNKMFEGRARSMQAQLDNLQQKNASLMAQMSKNSGEVVCPRKRVKVDNETGASKSVKQHEKEMNQMRETLRQVAEENSKLKSSFNSVMEEDDSLRKQLSDANEQNKVLEDRARSMQAQLDNLQQHETEMNQMRETLRQVAEENSKLKSSFNSVMGENDSLRKQLSDANEQNKVLEDRARSMQAQLDNLQQKNASLMAQKSKDSGEVVRPCQPVKEGKETGASKSVKQHEAEMNQMRETLRQVTEENSKLKLSFNSVMGENDSLRKQLSDANEQNKMFEGRARSMQAQLDNLQQKNASLMAQMSKNSGEVVCPRKRVKVDNETGASKSVKVLLNSKVYDLLTILMDWISNQHLSKIEIQGEREGNDKPQCAKENYTPENCMKLLHMVTGQLQWMPFVDPKLHMPVIQFIYWSLRQINTGSKHASMTSTMERLGEVIFKGVVHKGYLQKWSEKSTQSKPKTALFFKSSFMPLRFLSTLILLETAKRVSYLTRAFHSLCVDLKTDEGKMLFLQYQCVPVILSHLTISRKCLLSGALDALIEMARSSDKSHLQLFLEYCSTESVFRACSALLQNPRLDICFSKKICSMLRKLSEIKSNKKMFELFALPKVIKELLRTTHPDHHHFCVDLKVILCNLGVAKSNSAKLQSKDK